MNYSCFSCSQMDCVISELPCVNDTSNYITSGKHCTTWLPNPFQKTRGSSAAIPYPYGKHSLFSWLLQKESGFWAAQMLEAFTCKARLGNSDAILFIMLKLLFSQPTTSQPPLVSLQTPLYWQQRDILPEGHLSRRIKKCLSPYTVLT